MTETAYSTDRPDVVAAYLAAVGARREFVCRVVADAKALGKNEGVQRHGGLLGPDQTLGLDLDDPADPPQGWRYAKYSDVLLPRRGKVGEAAQRWLREHQPPDSADLRGILAAHGLPRNDRVDNRPGRYRLKVPAVLLHDGTVWARYRGTPDGTWTGDHGGCTWTPRKLSEFYAAYEAVYANEEADRATDGEVPS